MANDPEPAWLSAWQPGLIGTTEALSRFDSLLGVEPREMIGCWQGRSLPTQHPLDGLLEKLGWYGKAFESPEHVHPLMFRRLSGHISPLNPAFMPVRLALACPALAHSVLVRIAFDALFPVLQTRQHAAKLCACDFRGTRSTALVYTSQPIVDHLRRIDAQQVMGLMQLSGMERPFFFLLVREVASSWPQAR